MNFALAACSSRLLTTGREASAECELPGAWRVRHGFVANRTGAKSPKLAIHSHDIAHHDAAAPLETCVSLHGAGTHLNA